METTTQHTRALTKIKDVEAPCDLAMAAYNESRIRLIALGLAENDPVFLPLNLADTCEVFTLPHMF